MSMLLLEKLQKKPVPKEIKKPTAIKLGTEQVDIQIQLEDQSKTSNFEAGVDIHAKVTLLGEGSRGSLTKSLINSTLPKNIFSS